MLQPVEADRELGAQVAREVNQQIGVVDNPTLTAYLDDIGQRLTAQAADNRFEYSFQIIDQQEPNAFAAPGGYVYVSRGLLALINTEDELAGVIGHEISHVSRRHTAKQLAKKRVPKLLSLPGQVVGFVVDEDLGTLLNAPVGILGTAFLAKYSREDEREADDLGQLLAAQAGYDSRALADILHRMESAAALQTGGTRRASFFDTHPTTPDRVQSIESRTQAVQQELRPGIAGGRDETLRRLDGLIIGTNPANGVFDGRTFLHPEFDFHMTFPAQWKTMNTPGAVGAVAQEGDGLLVVAISGKGNNPKAAGLAFEKTLSEKFGVEPTETKDTNVGDLPAYLATFTDDSGREAAHLHFLWVAYRGMIYRMIGMGPERYRDKLRETALSFGPLTDEEKSAIKVQRLKVVAARAGEDMASLSRRTDNVWSHEETAIVNGISLVGKLEEGQLVKIVVSRKFFE
jgi:predicted Zn-dependent protease